MQITKQDWELVKKSCEDTIKTAKLDRAMAEVGLKKAELEIARCEFNDDEEKAFEEEASTNRTKSKDRVSKTPKCN